MFKADVSCLTLNCMPYYIMPRIPHHEIYSETVNLSNLSCFRDIVQAIIPLKYDDRFYHNFLEQYSGYILFHNQIPIGFVAFEIKQHMIYVLLIGIHPAYRNNRINLSEIS